VHGIGAPVIPASAAVTSYSQAGTGTLEAALHRHEQQPGADPMKKLAMIVGACVIGTAAYAQTTVIEKRDVPSTTIVKERSDPDVVVKKKEITTGTVGCSSKTVKKTNEFGDTKVKQKTEC
jgi:hypothetical protein